MPQEIEPSGSWNLTKNLYLCSRSWKTLTKTRHLFWRTLKIFVHPPMSRETRASANDILRSPHEITPPLGILLFLAGNDTSIQQKYPATSKNGLNGSKNAYSLDSWWIFRSHRYWLLSVDNKVEQTEFQSFAIRLNPRRLGYSIVLVENAYLRTISNSKIQFPIMSDVRRCLLYRRFIPTYRCIWCDSVNL